MLMFVLMRLKLCFTNNCYHFCLILILCTTNIRWIKAVYNSHVSFLILTAADFTLSTKASHCWPHAFDTKRPTFTSQRHDVVDGTVGKSSVQSAGYRFREDETRAFSVHACGTDRPDSWEERMETDRQPGEFGAEWPVACPLLVRITAAKRRLIAIFRSAIKQELHAKLRQISAAPHCWRGAASLCAIGRRTDGLDRQATGRHSEGWRLVDNSMLDRSISSAWFD